MVKRFVEFHLPVNTISFAVSKHEKITASMQHIQTKTGLTPTPVCKEQVFIN